MFIMTLRFHFSDINYSYGEIPRDRPVNNPTRVSIAGLINPRESDIEANADWSL